MKTILLIEAGARQTIYPPIGLMHLAAVLRKRYNILIKDYSGKDIDEDEVRQYIKKHNPFIVGVRVLTGPPIPRAIQISKIAKELSKIVVWGGPHPTILPEQTLKNPNIDSVVIGEGEYTFQKLIRYYEGKNTKLEGIGIKKKDKVIIFHPSKKSVNLNTLPLPSWDLVEDVKRYFPNDTHNELPISTTRGCAFKCGFCHNSNENVIKYLGCYRIADPQRAIEEYKFVQKVVKKNIDFLDVGEDLHLVSKDYAKRFCKAIKDSGLKIKWTTAARYQTLTREIIDMIADAGCVRIMLGVESGSKRIQVINNKVVDLAHAVKIATMLRKKGIFLTNTYIMGHPTEKPEELEETLKFIKEIPADENLIQLYRPMPGTPYFQICVREGRVKVPKSLEGWAGFGVLGHDTNVSKIPTKKLFSTFYKVNAVEQLKYWLNQQRFFLRNRMSEKFIKNFISNRFTFKLNEYLENKK